MSTIAVKIHSHRIRVAADTLLGNDHKRRNYKQAKVHYEPENGFLIASAGELEAFQFVKSVLTKNCIKPLRNISGVLPAAQSEEGITHFFQQIYPHMINDRAREKYHASKFIIIAGGKVYKHSNFFTAQPDADYLCIGSGARYAEAVLEFGGTEVNALRTARKLDLHTGGLETYEIMIPSKADTQ